MKKFHEMSNSSNVHDDTRDDDDDGDAPDFRLGTNEVGRGYVRVGGRCVGVGGEERRGG